MIDYIKEDNIIKLIVIVLAIFMLLKFEKCNRPEIKTIIKSDTTVVTHIDTVWSTDTIHHNIVIHEPDTVYIDSTSKRPISVYGEDFRDSLIEGTITAKVDGVLTGLDFQYTPLFPKYIYRTDTVKINTIEAEKPKINILVGGEIGGSLNSFDISPVIGLQNRAKSVFYYRYGILQGTHNIGVTIKLNKPTI